MILSVSASAQTVFTPADSQTLFDPSVIDRRSGPTPTTSNGIQSQILQPSSSPAGTEREQFKQYYEPDVTDITTYAVRTGDTLQSVATLFNISINTIRWQNDLKKGAAISAGQKLIILPITGLVHIVRKGDTLTSIAKSYTAELEDIKRFNDVSFDSDLTVGQKLIIPDGEKTEVIPIPKKQSIISKIGKWIAKPFIRGKWNSREMIVNGYMHPTRFSGVKTQGFHDGWRAIDIGAPFGTPIYASQSGTVAIANRSGWGGGYGLYVLIKHSNGSLTMYAHMSSVSVGVGERVSQGDQIGDVGSTGRSTGPHLHFEIRPPNGKSPSSWFPIPW